jgi:hypothetical protein
MQLTFYNSLLGYGLLTRQDIGNCFTSHFKNVFNSSVPTLDEDLMSLFDNCISPEENASICEIPTEQEIFFVLSKMGSTKVPGPDGFTALFYKKYWNIVKDVVLSSVWDFFGNNHLLKEQNHTFIALIPKKLGASTVNQVQAHKPMQYHLQDHLQNSG